MTIFSEQKISREEAISLPFTHVLTESQLELINKNSHIVKFKKKDVLFRQSTRASNVMFIKSGLVKVYKEGHNERVMILKIAKSGTFIGMMSVFSENVHQYSAAALTDTLVYDIDYMILKSILFENGKYSFNFLNLLSMDGLFIFDRLMSQSHKQLPGRVADVLLYFSDTIFNNKSFLLPLTRKELADFSGTTKESFIRTLTEFKNDKIIEIDGSWVSIISMDIIRTLSNLG